MKGQHVAHLVVEGGRIFRRLEVAVVLAPESPATGQPVEHLAGVALPAEHGLACGVHHRRAVLMDLRDSGLPEIFLRQNIDRQLRPMLRDVDMVQFKHGRSVGIADLRGTFYERKTLIGALPTLGESSFNPHWFLLRQMRDVRCRERSAMMCRGVIGKDGFSTESISSITALPTRYSDHIFLSNKMLWHTCD